MSIKELFDGSKRDLKRYGKIADQVLKLEPKYETYTEKEIKKETEKFKDRLSKGEKLDNLLPEAFALVREGSKRVLGLNPYKVQVISGIALHHGHVSEQKTGEGKTLTATMPTYLNALEGKGVHVVTVNDYLSERDAKEMGELYNYLGLTCGYNGPKMSKKEKQAAYQSDITYSTNNELGFDYLRGNMATNKDDKVQRELHYAIVDEVDSILIDEARTPLIISGAQGSSKGYYKLADTFAKSLDPKEDVIVDIEHRTAVLTPEGMNKAEKMFSLENLYDVKNQNILHHIENALQANFIMHNEKDYVVADGKVMIVDAFTGRIMDGRQYSDGLHQALEAKENVEIQQETKTMASITYQNFFRLYEKLSGMTGTALTEEEEFREIYGMSVLPIPTNKEVIRFDDKDILYPNLTSKIKALVKDVKERHEKGQPVLVGTVTVDMSEVLSQALKREKIPHNVLNAKNHGKEAEIIQNAGLQGAVTIATNMAGRGTDIKLGPGVKELGGLAVLGTERHESRRIDDQLRGRSGRQGDPGYSRFYLSLEDSLMQRFGSQRVKDLWEMIGHTGENDYIESRMITKQVESAQKRVEGNNYDARKNVLKYDDVMREQREVIYKQRNDVIDREKDFKEIILRMFEHTINRLVDTYTLGKTVDTEKLTEIFNAEICGRNIVKSDDLKGTPEDIKKELLKRAKALYHQKLYLPNITDYQREMYQKHTILSVVDKIWTDHLDYMDGLKQGIGLRGYAQDDPVVMYQQEAYDAYKRMIGMIHENIMKIILKANFGAV